MTPKEKAQAEKICELLRPRLKKIAITSAQRLVVAQFQKDKIELPEAKVLP